MKLELPRVRSRRERVARADEAAALIQALDAEDRALWASALYSGLRCGELQALHWHDLDFEARLIRVEHSWDRVVGLIELAAASRGSDSGWQSAPARARRVALLELAHLHRPLL
jgi:integrase